MPRGDRGIASLKVTGDNGDAVQGKGEDKQQTCIFADSRLLAEKKDKIGCGGQKVEKKTCLKE